MNDDTVVPPGVLARRHLTPTSPDHDQPTQFARARCKGVPGLFFAPYNERLAARHRREARAIALCATCPELVACRQHGRVHQEYGIWGGETEEERHRAVRDWTQPLELRRTPGNRS